MKKMPMVFVLSSFFLAASGLLSCLWALPADITLPESVKSLFQTKCAVCHKGKHPPANLNLEESRILSNLVNVQSHEKPEFKRVDPGVPETSYLLMKMKGTQGIAGSIMPPSKKESLSAEQIGLIENWILGLGEHSASMNKSSSPSGP